jgi:hypothetical protein
MGLFYGPNGGGKTVAAASFPGPIMIWDFDGRIEPVTAFYPNRSDIEYWTVGLEADTRRDVIGFRDFCGRFEKLQDRCPYETVVLDSYTSYSAVAVWDQMGVKKMNKESLKLTKGGLPIPDWDEYKGETSVMLQILEIAKILPCNFICTAHPVTRARTTKQGGNVNDVLASMVKASTFATYGWKTDSFLPNYFNEIYYMHADATGQIGQPITRLAQTVSAGEIVAKTALPLPNAIDFTGKPFYKIIQAILADHAIKIQEKMAAEDAAKAEVKA